MADARTYVKLHDGFSDHPKVLGVGGDAAWLYICGLCYCGRQLTDGRIPKTMVSRLSDRKNSERLAKRLVDVGLWRDTGRDYEVNDYLEHQRSADDVEELRIARAESSRKANHVKHHVKKNVRSSDCELCVSDPPPKSESEKPPKRLPNRRAGGDEADLRNGSLYTDTDTDIPPPTPSVRLEAPRLEEDFESEKPQVKPRPEAVLTRESPAQSHDLDPPEPEIRDGMMVVDPPPPRPKTPAHGTDERNEFGWRTGMTVEHQGFAGVLDEVCQILADQDFQRNVAEGHVVNVPYGWRRQATETRRARHEPDARERLAERPDTTVRDLVLWLDPQADDPDDPDGSRKAAANRERQLAERRAEDERRANQDPAEVAALRAEIDKTRARFERRDAS